jgi:hypothetical protein
VSTVSTDLYLMAGLQEGRVPSDRDLRQQREARLQRRLQHALRRPRRHRR